jgi:tetratricopeptide (TPR) repeat protein
VTSQGLSGARRLVVRLGGGKHKAALARALRARDAHDWTTAAQHYRLYLQSRPKHFAIWVQLGHALKESGHLADAHAAYSEAQLLDPRDSDLLLSVGHLYKLMGRQDEAIAFYRQSAEQDGNAHARAELQRLGAHLTAAGDGRPQPPSQPPAPVARTTRPFDIGARKSLALADAARDRRDWNGAVEHYRDYLMARTSRFAVWVQLGHALKEAGRRSEALLVYNEARQLKPNDPDLLLNMGHLYKLLGDTQEAIACYRRSAELDHNRHATAELRHLGAAPP